MAGEEPLTESLQEAILAVLAFDAKHGALIATQVAPEHFSGQYHEIAGPVLEYRKKYGKPPGHAHLEHIFSRSKLDPTDRRTAALRRTLVNLSTQAEALNAEYIVSRVQDFVRSQKLISALLAANDRAVQGGEGMATDVEGILHTALRYRQTTLDAGTFLNQVEKSALFAPRAEETYALNIRELDRLSIGPAAKRLLLYIGPKNCLVGGTLIDCPRDLSKYPEGIPIKDLLGKSFWTYSWNFDLGRPCLAKVKDVWRVGKRRVYRVKLSAHLRELVGKKGGGTHRAKYLPPLELVGTYDHPVLLSDGTWKNLGELVPGDSLKSLYRLAGHKAGYAGLRWTGSGPKSVGENRFICSEFFGEEPESVHAHHKDHNKINNSPENLCWMDAADHHAYHLGLRNINGTAGWRVTGEHPRGMAGKTHSRKTKKRQRAAMLRIVKTRLRGPRGTFIKAPNHKVVSIEGVGVQEVFDMEVAGTNNFVANGVFVHNSGKSWFCVHVGRQALLQKAKVVHISLEMSERELLGRYYQNFFGIATRPDLYTKATLEFDELERLTGFKVKRSKPRLDYGDPGIRKYLRSKVQTWGTRFKRLVIKEFPSGTLTMDALRGYLDYLELVEKFIPNVLIVDYPDLFALKSNDYRLALGRIFVELRGLGSERNLAVVAPTQSGRSSIGAKRVSSANVTEDISKVFTADLVLAYSQTNAEEKLGLARLSVEHARNAPKGSVILLSQSYSTGQYVLESAALTSNAYWEKLKEVTGDDETSDRT